MEAQAGRMMGRTQNSRPHRYLEAHQTQSPFGKNGNYSSFKLRSEYKPHTEASGREVLGPPF